MDMIKVGAQQLDMSCIKILVGTWGSLKGEEWVGKKKAER